MPRVACGLYYLAELVEEYTGDRQRTLRLPRALKNAWAPKGLAKRVLRDVILFVLVLHLLLLLLEDFPSLLILLGLIRSAHFHVLARPGAQRMLTAATPPTSRW